MGRRGGWDGVVQGEDVLLGVVVIGGGRGGCRRDVGAQTRGVINGLTMIAVKPVFIFHADSISPGVETLVFDPGLPTFGAIDEPGGRMDIDVVNWCEDSGSRYENLEDFNLGRVANEGKGSRLGEVGWDIVTELADELRDLFRHGGVLVE